VQKAENFQIGDCGSAIKMTNARWDVHVLSPAGLVEDYGIQSVRRGKMSESSEE
jgi:hypothetical protein